MLKNKSLLNFLPFFICLLYFFYGFWHTPLFPPDEPKYTFAAVKMIESGDFFTPYFNCNIRLEKPIFTYWAIVLSYKIFGISDWAARIPTIILMSLLLISLFFITKREFNAKTALLASLFFATNFQINIYSKAIVPEPFLLVFNTLATFAFYFGIRDDSKKYIILGFLFSALAFLTKGPLGIIIPLGINIPYFFVRRGLQKAVKPFLNISGILLFVAINLPWYGMMIKIHGMNFINEFFILHNLKRFSGGAAMHLYPFYYYVPVILLSLFSWLAYLPKFLKYFFSPKFTETEKFLFWWTIFVFLFFSLSKNKLHHYIIIIHPPLSILMALCFDKLQEKKIFSNAVLMILLVLETGFLFLGDRIYGSFDYDLKIFLTFLPLSTLIILISNNTLEKKATFLINTFTFFIFTLFILHYAETIKNRTMPAYKTVKSALEGKTLLSYKRDSEDINFYANICSSKIESLKELDELMKEDLPFLLVVHEKHLKELSGYSYRIVTKSTSIKNVNWYILDFRQ